MATSQPVRLKSTFGEDLLFSRMEGFEELGRLFQYELELVSLKHDLALDDLLGKDVTIEMDFVDDGKRFFHGYVTEFSHTGGRGRYATYAAVVHPWLWFLTRTSDCRIFQEKTVPDIIKQVFRDLGFTDFKDSLSAKYRKWEYCVQYRETNFNFVSRLMEQEGIYYFWEHADGKHTLVLADAAGAHSPLPKYEKLLYRPPSELYSEEHINDWHLSKSVRSGTCAIGAFHFMKPGANLEVTASIMHPHDYETFEIYDYPGEYYERGEGDRYVGVRMEELACDYERVRGETNARGIFPGGLFELEEHPRKDQNREYLVLTAHHSLIGVDYESGAAEAFKYSCSFESINSQDPFRTARTTPKPIVQGPQTAVVVGKSGEEIWTDEYGRVKVHFHWDRHGKKDENASCWVRVAQVWAGGQWGGMTIPRMGQEVIVDFIEGDPDRPIVTGRVYNADNMPPYKLPDDKTRSTLKSQSSKGGTAKDNFNEIRFEDKMGEEEIYIHAEKDQNTVVENNQTIAIGFDKADAGDRALAVNNDESIEIGRDRTMLVGQDKDETIGRDKSITVKSGHSESIGADMSINVASNLTETIGVNYAETVGVSMELTVGAALAISVGASMQETVGAIKDERIGASKSLNIGKNYDQKIGADQVVDIAKDYKEDIGGQYRQTVAKQFEVTAKKVQFVAKDELNIKVGKAQLVLKKNGDITMKGKKINVKGSGDVIVKGSKIKEN